MFKAILVIQIIILNALITSAQTFDVDTLQFNGNIGKYINLVILSDGYQENQLEKFERDAEEFRSTIFSQTPFAEYQNYFNVFIIKVPSIESGASHPGTATDVNEPAHPVSQIDNYFGSSFDASGIHRLLVARKTIEIANVLAFNFPSYDQVLILVNSPYYGGNGGRYPTASLNAASSEIAIHEIGHSFASLADEYYAGNNFAREAINMTKETDPSLVKWRNWINLNGIGIYEHCCGGNSRLWYRPHQDCKMRVLDAPFCSVCREGIVEEIHDLTSPLLDFSPLKNQFISSELPISFHLKTIKPNPNTLKINWFLNDQVIHSNIDSVLIDASDLTTHQNTLLATIQDTSPLLKVDNHENLHFYTVQWSIENTLTATNEITGESNEIRIDIYPNPSQDKFHVNYNFQREGIKSITISDLNGHIILKDNLNSENQKSYDLSKYPEGTYLINFFIGNTLLTSRKVVKL